MSLIVQKYGGSSVAGAAQLRRVAARIARTRRAGHEVVAVVSAMGGATDGLLELAGQVSARPPRRELDLLLSAGEQVSSSLLAMAVQGLGLEAIALTGRQVGIHTSGAHGNAQIERVDTARLRRELDEGRVVVVAGYQGVTEQGEVTTLGRGGSDTTAVAIAAAMGADRCQILSDVDGVYTADPRLVRSARRLERISHEEMEELARSGARVLNEAAVRFAAEAGITIEAAGSFQDGAGTRIEAFAGSGGSGPARACGVAGRDDLLWVRGRRSGESPGLAAELVEALSGLELLHADEGGPERSAELLFSLENEPEPLRARELIEAEFAHAATASLGLGTATIVGRELGACNLASGRFGRILGSSGVRPQRLLARRHARTCLVRKEEMKAVLEALHEGFLGAAMSVREAS